VDARAELRLIGKVHRRLTSVALKPPHKSALFSGIFGAGCDFRGIALDAAFKPRFTESSSRLLASSIADQKASQSLPAFEEGAVIAPPQSAKG